MLYTDGLPLTQRKAYRRDSKSSRRLELEGREGKLDVGEMKQ